MTRSTVVNIILITTCLSCLIVLPGNAKDDIHKSDARDSLEYESQVAEEPVAVTERAICTGCVTDTNEEDPYIWEIANYAFKSYSDSVDGQEDVAQSLVRVLKAKKQVVAGYKYILDLEIGWTQCSRMEYNSDPSKCPLDSTRNNIVCNFEILEQKWLNQMTVLSSKCNKDKNEENSVDAAEEKGNDEIQGVDDFTDSENNVNMPYRKKREAPFVKSPTIDASNDNETFMNLAKFAVEQLDSIDEDTKARFPITVLSGRKQTISVPGWLYHLKILVGYTECSEDPPKTFEECKSNLTMPYYICHVKILFQPWQTVQSKMTESQCYPNNEKNKKHRGRKLKAFHEEAVGNEISKMTRNKKDLIGGFTSVDPTSESISKLADFVVVSLDEQQNSLHAQKIVRVVEARKQIVNGIKTKLSLELGFTRCRKTRQLVRSTCDIDNERDRNLCHVTVWEQPWKNSTKITHAKCGKIRTNNDHINERSKRGTLFSFQQLDLQREEFAHFMTKYEKSYKDRNELEYRLSIFKNNMKTIKLLQDNEQGTATYGATTFADLTEEEFASQHLGLRPDLRHLRHRKKAKIPLLTKIPDEFDWRHYNVVTAVKNQGFCGSCWAFSVTGNIEGAYAIKHKQLLAFSEQELVDCDTLDEGCNGGLPENAYKSLEKLGGLESETAYPYEGKNDKCSYNSTKAEAKVTGFVEVPKNETEMAMWLVKRGPMSIGINANAMQFYFGGVSHPWKFLCSPKSLDHGVLIVGFGVHTQAVSHKQLPYWLIKNSWGPHWGEQGYYRVYRGQNTCGVAEMVTSAIVA